MLLNQMFVYFCSLIVSIKLLVTFVVMSACTAVPLHVLGRLIVIVNSSIARRRALFEHFFLLVRRGVEFDSIFGRFTRLYKEN